MVNSIKACIKNARRYTKNSVEENTPTRENIDDSIEVMKIEMEKSLQPSLRILNKGMDATRNQRKTDAKSMPALLMLQKYPALKLKSIVRTIDIFALKYLKVLKTNQLIVYCCYFVIQLMREFSKIVNIPERELAENWGDALSKIAKNLNLNIPENSGTDLSSLELLQALPRLFRSTKKQTQRLLEIYEVCFYIIYIKGHKH